MRISYFSNLGLLLSLLAFDLFAGSPTVTSIGPIVEHDEYANAQRGVLAQVSVPLVLVNNTSTTQVTLWFDKNDGNGPQNQGWWPIGGNSGAITVGGEGANTSVWMPDKDTLWIVKACAGTVSGNIVPEWAASTSS